MWLTRVGSKVTAPQGILATPEADLKADNAARRAQVIQYSNGAKEVIYDDDLPPILQAAMWNGKIGNS